MLKTVLDLTCLSRNREIDSERLEMLGGAI